MSFGGVNYLAILIAAVAAFVFGSVWYGVLGKRWMAAQDKIPTPGAKGMPPIPLLALTLFAQLVMAYVLAAIVGHLSADQNSLLNGLHAGFFAWLGFVVTTIAVNYGYQSRKPALSIIDSAHWLGVLLIEGAIIGAFGH